MRTTVIVLAFNEVLSLEETIKELVTIGDSANGQLDIVISTSKFAEVKTIIEAQRLASIHEHVRVYFQTKPFVAAAVLEVLNNVDSDYVIYMSADKETPASLVPKLMSEIHENSLDVVLASRWMRGGSIENYGKIKFTVSAAAQLLCRLLFKWQISEYTYGFRIYRTDAIKSCQFKETKHPFFLESILIPARLGMSISEIPVRWTPRDESKSTVSPLIWAHYLLPILRVRFLPQRKLLIRN